MRLSILLVACCVVALALLAPHGVQAQFCQGPNGPYYCGDPDSCNACAINGWSCDHTCDNFGVATTCGAYFGNPPNDLDSDGVANGSDNCTCTANSGQADCDSDGFGNACDPTDNSWTRIDFGINTCHVDIDDHVIYETMEFYRRDLYQSACTGGTCVRKLLLDSFNCYTDASQSCCQQKAIGHSQDCGLPWGFDACGTPLCPF